MIWKDYYPPERLLIEQLKKERDDFIAKIENNSRVIGVLETKLLQLEAPRPDTAPQSAPYIPYRHVEHTPPAETYSPPAPAPDQGASFPDTDDHYDHQPREHFEDQR